VCTATKQLNEQHHKLTNCRYADCTHS